MILLVGTSAAALEGMSQTLAAVGLASRVATSLGEARELAIVMRPLILVVEHGLAASSTAETLGIPLVPGGALVLWRAGNAARQPLSPTVQRVVLADLTLPLERNRLIALIHHVADRARAAGRVAGSRREGELRI